MSPLFIFSFYLLSYNSPVCTCDELKSDKDIDAMVRDADVVFIGTVCEYYNDEQSALFKVDTLYKGDISDRLKVSQTIACAKNFKKGQKYLVLGDLNSFTVYTNLCRSFVFHPDIARINKIVHRLSQRTK